MESMYLIESMKHTYGDEIAWWRPNRLGYTTDLVEAGRYGKTEAEEIVTKSNTVGSNSRMWLESDVLGGRAGHVAMTVRKF